MSGETDEIAVLYVDADTSFAEHTAQSLERQPGNLTVDTAPDADAARSMLASTGYDCIISEYDIPDQDGIELLETVRDDHPDVPFILYTETGSDGVASDAISAGVTEYVKKQPGDEQHAVLANRIRNAVDRYRTRRRHQDSERHPSQVYERITDGFFGVNSDWEYTYVNEPGAEMVGRNRKAMIGEPVWSVFPELEGTPFEEALRTAMESQEPTSVEEYYPAHETWYDVSVYPDSEGISIFFRDVTDRHERERTLAQAETIFNHTQDAIFLIDVEDDAFRIERVNQAYEALTGVSNAELQGEPIRDVVGAGYGEEVAARYQECVDRQEPIEYEEELPIGDKRFWQTKLAPVLDDGEVVQLVGATRDITDRKRREEELELYEAIVENSEDGVYVFDADGYFEFVNKRVEAVAGISRDAWIGEHISIHTEMGTLTEAEVDAIQDGIDAVVAGECDDVRVELEPDIPSGVGVLEMRLTGFQTEEGEDRVIGFTRDITERKQSQTELEQRNERLDQFASVVSHDLRNPLNVAVGRLELARQEVSNEHLPAVAQAHARMETLIENLLALARKGERIPDKEPVSLAAVVQACWANVDTRGAELVVVAERDIVADPDSVAQLVENLFRNAIEHGGSDVTVTVGDLDDGFFVSDDGAGFPSGEYDQVFEAGYSTGSAGVGFGLSIVAEIAEAHGWTVRATDSEGGGARIEVRGVERP